MPIPCRAGSTASVSGAPFPSSSSGAVAMAEEGARVGKILLMAALVFSAAAFKDFRIAGAVDVLK